MVNPLSNRQALRIFLSIALAAPFFFHSAWSFELVDFAEVERLEAEDFKDRAVPRSDPDGPQIDLLRPVLDQAGISSPLEIEVSFHARPPAAVQVDTLKVYYHRRFFALDITDRLMPHADISDSRLYVAGAELPPGNHSVSVVVEDTIGRPGVRRFDVRVEAE